MNIPEFHLAIDIELDKSLSFEYPYIQPEVKDYWLNKAQLEVVNDLAYPENPDKKGYEHGEKRVDELKDITVTSPDITPVRVGSVFESDLPNDYSNLVRHWCKVSNKSGTKLEEVGGLQTRQDSINVLLKNPFWEPVLKEPLFYIQGSKIFYETKNNFDVLNTRVTYLKIPTKMQYGEAYSNPTTNVECEFKSEHMQHKIIDKAVAMILENIESQRYQTNLNELNN